MPTQQTRLDDHTNEPHSVSINLDTLCLYGDRELGAVTVRQFLAKNELFFTDYCLGESLYYYQLGNNLVHE